MNPTPSIVISVSNINPHDAIFVHLFLTGTCWKKNTPKAKAAEDEAGAEAERNLASERNPSKGHPRQ
jgi:hypothetical protein